ncbi:hypothetical protein HRI_003200100 [Hibiscus trionum]|uniref:BHLH domain-containing protein n=1 Tax=Hibiscus trionum TaxID=183268 RepID=A0A9W7IH91_HIBTR|nr:hypothetical protein HRI_003200100 [Hibiscus trionum]
MDLQSFRQSFPSLDTDPTLQFGELNMDMPALNYQTFFPFSNQVSEIQNINKSLVSIGQPVFVQDISNKRKALDVSESSCGNSSSFSQVRGSNLGVVNGKNWVVSVAHIRILNAQSLSLSVFNLVWMIVMQTPVRGKRAKTKANANAKEEEKPKQVVHVRARRGEATDSHSLAERVRRQKINDRLRCLQDIVPGCYKTMGMAVMLDEIISYVQSLQNQVEFLSMKLTAASTYYDFNSDLDAMERLQREKAEEAKELERWMGEGYVGVGFHSTSPWS